MKTFKSLMLLILVGLWTDPLYAGDDFQEGWRAYRSGDFQTAYNLWLPLAQSGSGLAQNNLGMMYLTGRGVAKDYGQAVHWFSLAVINGNVEAQTSLGAMYIQGLGVEQDYSAAFELFYAAAREGYAPAQFNMGRMYSEGIGVSRDYNKAMKWFGLAADQGHEGARHNQQELAAKGLGLHRSPYVKDSRWVKFG